MTTLDDFEVYRNNEYIVFKHIAGDLSHTFDVVPKSQSYRDGGRGIGIATRTLSEAKQVISLADKIGYDKAGEETRKGYYAPSHHFGYVTGTEAEKYAQYEGAYGEKVQEIRNKLAKKRMKPSFMNQPEWNKIVNKNIKTVHVRGYHRDVAKDSRLQAMKAGKRKSASGRTYYESRPNRSDKGRWL